MKVSLPFSRREQSKQSGKLVNYRSKRLEFIMENELPPLLEASDKDGAVILPTVVALL